jgi:DNA-binding CsgD family transcriptional regulator
MVNTSSGALRAAHATRHAYAPKLALVEERASPNTGDELYAAIFDQSPVSILVTRQRAVERSNAAAAALLAVGRPIGVSAGRLQFDDARAHAAFEQMSRADVQVTGAQAYAFVVEGTGGRTYIAQLSHARSSAVVIVALTPFNGASQARETMLNGFTDLTPTERTIFAAFVDGHDIPAIAAKMQRSVETVRWHVRNLFTKLGVNSQADLARLGALLLPI